MNYRKHTRDASPKNYNERVFNWPASREYSTFEPTASSLARIYYPGSLRTYSVTRRVEKLLARRVVTETTCTARQASWHIRRSERFLSPQQSYV